MEELIIADEFNIDDLIEDDSSSNATNNNNNDDGCQYQFECDVEYQFKYTEWTISIVFHQTWCVPTLYFTCAQTDGTPLCRQQVLDILLLQYNMKIKIIILNVEILWKFTSQEEHPMTGQPCNFCIRVELPRGWT